MTKPTLPRLYVFKDGKRAEKENPRAIDSAKFMAALPKSRWIK